jgi:hypothetical protein
MEGVTKVVAVSPLYAIWNTARMDDNGSTKPSTLLCRSNCANQTNFDGLAACGNYEMGLHYYLYIQVIVGRSTTLIMVERKSMLLLV